MKHKWPFTLLFVALFGLMSCLSKAQNTTPQNADEENILIVYLSRTGNTEAIAQIINEEVDGTLVELELVTSHPEDYDAIVTAS